VSEVSHKNKIQPPLQAPLPPHHFEQLQCRDPALAACLNLLAVLPAQAEGLFVSLAKTGSHDLLRQLFESCAPSKVSLQSIWMAARAYRAERLELRNKDRLLLAQVVGSDCAAGLLFPAATQSSGEAEGFAHCWRAACALNPDDSFARTAPGVVWAMLGDDEELAAALLSKDPPNAWCSFTNSSLLALAILKSMPSIAATLLRIDEQSSLPHHSACFALRDLPLMDITSSNLAISAIRKASPSLFSAVCGPEFLRRAAATGDRLLVIDLIKLELGCSIDKNGFSPLHYAAHGSFTEIYLILSKAGHDPQLSSVSGITPADIFSGKVKVLPPLLPSPPYA
jgi:hypothetical protein